MASSLMDMEDSSMTVLFFGCDKMITLRFPFSIGLGGSGGGKTSLSLSEDFEAFRRGSVAEREEGLGVAASSDEEDDEDVFKIVSTIVA